MYKTALNQKGLLQPLRTLQKVHYSSEKLSVTSSFKITKRSLEYFTEGNSSRPERTGVNVLFVLQFETLLQQHM